MSELLCPAGTLEAFHAAISNGANAIYLGLNKFSARAYAENFTLENLPELVKFAHLRNVKIYVTVNTITYDNELEEAYRTIDALAAMHVDGVIVQDMAIITYVTSHYKSLQVSMSTQCGIDDEDGVRFAQDLGAGRVVFARETPIAKLKKIKEATGIEVEAFVHGALCVSYSGNCLMSSMIGERSGNRGRCAGCCRKPYALVDRESKETIQKGYLLSMKDLNLSEEVVKDMSFVDSLKIEGRMKDARYVSGVTRLYRKKLDGEEINEEDFNKIFNRTYTKGFIGGETAATVTNIEKPNNYGYLIGTITRQFRGKIWIRLNKELNKGDQIRVESSDIFKEISVPVTKMFDNAGKEIETANKFAVTYCDKFVKVGAKVYKTKDIKFIEKTEQDNRPSEYKKFPIDMHLSAYIDKPLTLTVAYEGYGETATSEFIVQKSLTSSITDENIEKQLSKLNETPYRLGELTIEKDDGIFAPLKAINELRRIAIEKLNEARLAFKIVPGKEVRIEPKKVEAKPVELTVEVTNEEQYEIAKELGVEHIYFKNVFRRNHVTYKDMEGEVVVGGLGGIRHYEGKNPIVSDYSFNVVNSKTVALFSTLGVERITLSQEINKESINALVANYRETYGTNPNLELIVYGRTKVMHSQYCPLKRLGMCGECKKHKYALKDDFASFPLQFNDDCTTTIYNSRTLNLIEDIDGLEGVNYFRLSFSTENAEETRRVIAAWQEKIATGYCRMSFDKMKDTHGHFLKNPL